MSSADPAVETVSAAATARTVAALAVRHFEIPAAVVLQREFTGWRALASHGKQADRLVGDMLRHAAVFDAGESLVVVPDLDDDPRQRDAFLESAVPGAPRLRFLAGTIHGPDAPASAVCLCLLDVLPRQLAADDRKLLVDLGEMIAAEFWQPVPDATGRTADMIALPRHDLDLSQADASSEVVRLEERVLELTRLNESLRAEIGDHSEDVLERARFDQLIAESSDCVGLATLDGKIYYLNAAGQRLVSLDGAADVKRTRIIDYLIREDRSFFLGTVIPTLMRTGRWEGDARFRNFKTGGTIPVSWNLFLLKDPHTGEPSGMASVARDITERQRAETALRESEKRFRHLVEQAGDAIFVYDLAGQLIDVNQEACDSLGYTRAELLALSARDIDAGFEAEKQGDRWKGMVPGVANTMNGTLRRKDGTTFPTESRIAVFRSEGQKLVLALVRDITERKRAEEALQQTHEQLEARVRERTAELARANDGLRDALRENSRLAAAIDSCQIGVLISDPQQPDAPTIFVNPAFTRITGYQRQETIGRNCRFLQGPETDPAEIDRIRQAVAARRPYRGTMRNYRKDGTPFWNELTINPVFDDAGALIYFVGIQADVTVQVEALEALRRSELRIARMTANVPGMVYQLLLHEDGTASFPYVSEGCRELFGMEPAQMRPDACTLLDLIHPEDIGNFLSTLDESKISSAAWVWEGRYQVGAGKETRWLQGAARPERQVGGSTLWDGLLLDITTRKRAEQGIEDRASQAAAVAALGQSALSSSNHIQLAKAAADAVISTLGTEMCIVTELLPGGRELIARAGAGLDREITDTTFPAGAESLAGYAILAGQPVIIEDLRVTARCKISPLWLDNGAISSLSVVIQGRGQPLGALCIAARQTRHFGPEDVNFLQSVANVLASTMDRARDEQALRKSEARNAAILQTALDPIITIDHDDLIVEFNPAAEKTFGYGRAAALGRPFSELVPNVLGVSAKNLGERIELPARHADGTLITAELAVTRIPVEGLPLFTAYLRDITQRKQAQEAMRAAKEEAERANNAKSEFLSRMSHELRTPLNAILGFGQLLQMQGLTTAQNDRVGHIVNAGRHLLDLINEVLDIARIEAGRVELSLEPVRVSDALTETLDLIRPLANERGVTFDALSGEHPLTQGHVMADRQRFKQVLLNLFSNAVKYNRQGGAVSITFEPAAEGRLRLTVTDTGVGIAPENLARLFVAFDRLGAEHSAVQGTGLGLALSKRLIEAMGGQVGVESKLGEGTCFWVELPRAESQLELIVRRGQDVRIPGMEALKDVHDILYIEDNLSNLTLIEHLLADQPHIRLMTAMLGRLGLDLARQHRPNLILLDLHLPDLPGWDVLAALQADEATRQIPVIVVSADATPRQIEKLMKAGARAYLTKPLEVERFQRVLRQLLEPQSVL